MTRRRAVLLVLLLAAITLAVAVGLPRTGVPPGDAPGSTGPATTAATTAATQPTSELAQRLVEHAVARSRGDQQTLLELSRGDDVAAYRAARDLAEDDALDAATRSDATRRVLELRIDEPLARRELTELHLTLGRTSDAAGRTSLAVEAYREALPDPRARDALRALIDDPYRLANAFLQGRLHQAALDALDGLAAPSIEAPALRALDRHEEALNAYRAWLDQVPGHVDARFGVAWSHWYLGDLAAAEAAFRDLDGPQALYGRALIANRRGDRPEAVRLLRATGVPARLWLATSLLEGDQRWSEAIDVYLDLAAGDSVYADDAAWRALVLARRTGATELVARAEQAIPAGSFFALRLDDGAIAPRLPTHDDLAATRPEALETARWLAESDDPEGARLVLAFALRTASDEAEIVALGEALQALNEYRIPQRAATALLSDGSAQLRTWRLAYPEAWPDLVRVQAKRADVDPHLVWAVMRRESAFYPGAISRSGAQGLMQVMPSTWDWIAELQNEAPADPFEVADNIRYGVHYLGWLQEYFSGDEELVVPSYNRGQGYIRRLYDSDEVRRDKDDLYRAIDALETREYLQNVLVTRWIYDRLAEIEAGLASR
ncbi:MAG: transglycosylase SLT domain-containing protein [Trueperaceae bacterium]|nr:transglycosylase SLT domain-containing protein [Trueperaceae bacterium]